MSSELKISVVSGIKWLAFSKALIQLFRWVSTLWVIRLLSAEDYGIIAIAEIMASLLASVNFLCIGNIIIRFKTVSKPVMDTLFTCCLLIGIGLFCLQFFSAGYFAQFYQTPEAELVLQVTALTYLIAAVNVKPMALLAKQMQFKQLAKIDMTAGIAMTISVLICAYAGMGYWSLAVGSLVNIVAITSMANYFHKSSFKFATRFKRVLPLLKFGLQNTGSSIIAQINNSLDFIIGGQIFTTSQIGSYQVGLQVSYIPLRKISPELRRIAFSAFSKINNDRVRVTSYYLKSSKFISIVVFPLFWGLGIMAESVVEVILTNEWIESAAVIQVICFALPFKLLTEKTNTTLNAMGRADILLKTSLFASLMFLVILPLTLHIGIAGLAYAWFFSILLTYLLVIYHLGKILPVNIVQILFNYDTAIISSIFMLISVYGFSIIFTSFTVFTMLSQIVVGIVVYFAVILVFYRPIFLEFRQLISNSRPKTS